MVMGDGARHGGGWCWGSRENCHPGSKCVWTPGPSGPRQPGLCADTPRRCPGRSRPLKGTRNGSSYDIFPNIKLENTIIFQPTTGSLPLLCELQPTFSKFSKDMCLLDLKPGFLRNENPQRMRKWPEENRYLLKVMIWAVCWT